MGLFAEMITIFALEVLIRGPHVQVDRLQLMDPLVVPVQPVVFVLLVSHLKAVQLAINPLLVPLLVHLVNRVQLQLADQHRLHHQLENGQLQVKLLNLNAQLVILAQME